MAEYILKTRRPKARNWKAVETGRGPAGLARLEELARSIRASDPTYRTVAEIRIDPACASEKKKPRTPRKGMP